MPAYFSNACAYIGFGGHVDVRVAETGINADEQVEVGVVDVLLVSASDGAELACGSVRKRAEACGSVRKTLELVSHKNGSGDEMEMLEMHLWAMTCVQDVGDEAHASI